MKTLFIGGIADGKWMYIDPDLDFVDVPDESESVYLPVFDPTEKVKRETYTVARYTLQKLASPYRDYRVMVLLEEHECIIDKLLKGYKSDG